MGYFVVKIDIIKANKALTDSLSLLGNPNSPHLNSTIKNREIAQQLEESAMCKYRE